MLHKAQMAQNAYFSWNTGINAVLNYPESSENCLKCYVDHQQTFRSTGEKISHVTTRAHKSLASICLKCYVDDQRTFRSTRKIMGRESSRERGMDFKQWIARLFTQAGYSVAMSYKSRDPFDFIATRDDAILAVQVKTTQGPGRPPIDMRRCAAYPLPDGAQRLYWHHCGKYDHHRVYRIGIDNARAQITGFDQARLDPVPNPLGFMFPPPLDKKTVSASTKLHKTRTQKSLVTLADD